MAWPETQAEAFDLSSHRIEDQEVERIREAVVTRRVQVSTHALQRAGTYGLSTADMISVIINGTPIEKDLPTNNRDRKPGIAFAGTGPSGVKLKTKVTFINGIGYEVVTVHPMEEGTDGGA